MALAKTAEAVLKIQAALFTQLKQGVNQRRLSQKKLGDRHQSLQARACGLPRVQPGAVWRNSCSAPAAANSGHADIATIIEERFDGKLNGFFAGEIRSG